MKRRVFTLIVPVILSQALSAQTAIKVAAPVGTDSYFPLVREAYAEMGYRAEIIVMPPERAISDVNNGVYDAHIGTTVDILPSYPNTVATTESINVVNLQAWIKKGSPLALTGPDDLAAFKVGVIRGSKVCEVYVEKMKLVFVKADSIDALAKMLDCGRVDVAIVSSVLPSAALEKIGTLALPELTSVLVFHVFNMKNASLIEKWDAVLKAMKADGRYKKHMSGK